MTWEILQELSDTFVGPNAAPIEPAVKTARNIAAEPLRPSHRPNAEPAHTIQEQLDVTIGNIEVTIESEPQPPSARNVQSRAAPHRPNPRRSPQPDAWRASTWTGDRGTAMALSDTGTAIGSVSRLVKEALTNALKDALPSPNVSIGAPRATGA